MCSKRMKGFIYKITSPSTDKIYVGSTTKTLNIRLEKHISNIKQCKLTSRFILCFNDAIIECLEEVEFENRKQLRIRERHHIELNRDRCVNKHIPSRTRKEYELANAVKLHNYQVDYCNMRKEKFNCECGSIISNGYKATHLKTLIHQNYIASII